MYQIGSLGYSKVPVYYIYMYQKSTVAYMNYVTDSYLDNLCLNSLGYNKVPVYYIYMYQIGSLGYNKVPVYYNHMSYV